MSDKINIYYLLFNYSAYKNILIVLYTLTYLLMPIYVIWDKPGFVFKNLQPRVCSLYYLSFYVRIILMGAYIKYLSYLNMLIKMKYLQ